MTRDEFNERLNGITDVLEKKIYKEILSSYIKPQEQVTAVKSRGSEEMITPVIPAGDESLAENLSRYSGVMDSVMSWSDDG